MNKILRLFSFLSILVISTNSVVSCFEPSNDPFEYVPYKISGFYNKLEKIAPIILSNEDLTETVDYSPLLSEALKSFGSDKFQTSSHEHLREQFINEYSFHKKYAIESEFSNYNNLILQDNEVLTYLDSNEKYQNLNQIIRIDNYFATPSDINGSVYFDKITYCKWEFSYIDQNNGSYNSLNSCKNVEIYLEGTTVAEINASAININKFFFQFHHQK